MKKNGSAWKPNPTNCVTKNEIHNICRGRVPSRPENFILLQPSQSFFTAPLLCESLLDAVYAQPAFETL